MTAINIVINQGETYSAIFEVTDADGEAVDLTGYSSRSQLRRSYSSSSAISFDTAVSGSNVSIGLSDDVSSEMDAGRYVYDVEVEADDGTVTRIAEGTAILKPEVTR